MLKNDKKNFRKCDHPECELEGEFRAPKNRNLDEYYWFCLEHVKQYNKNWNFYDGMSVDEIQAENKKDETWHAPSWKFGLSLDQMAKDGKLDDPFLIYNTYMKKKPASGYAGGGSSDVSSKIALNAKELKALKVMELSFPYTEKDLKSRYKILVKKHHPDLHNGAKDQEEIFKMVASSYQILLKKIEKK